MSFIFKRVSEIISRLAEIISERAAEKILRPLTADYTSGKRWVQGCYPAVEYHLFFGLTGAR